MVAEIRFGPAGQIRRGALAALVCLTSAIAGCASLPPPRLARGDTSPPAATALGADGRVHMTLDVMTYNIEGLGWPARAGRRAELAQIGERLAALRREGRAPDVIVFQEVFSRAARRAVGATGYPDEVAGPSRGKRRSLPADGRVTGIRRWGEGELGVRLASGGLAIVSRYPVTAYRAEPFAHHACAGLDCLSNKGALFARVAVPGAPEPLEVFDSHLNSRHASGASARRSLAAHHLEARELADFIAQQHAPGAPAILAGDFNVRHSAARFETFEPLQPLTLAHRFCRDTSNGCEVAPPWTDDAPWLDTEDLQFFRSGERVRIRPLKMETLFDGAAEGPRLSDHVGLRVVYDLSWPAPPSPRGASATGLPPQRS